MNGDILKEHEIFTKSGALFALEKGFIKVTGPDRTDFLHRISSQDIKNLLPGTGSSAALLQSNASILVHFDIYNCGQFFLIVIDQGDLQKCLEQLEKYHFAENLEIKNVTTDFKFLSAQGMYVDQEVQMALGRAPSRKLEVIGLEECLIVSKPDFQKTKKGYHLFIKADHYELVLSNLEKQKLRILSNELWDLLRVESGHFSFGVDINDKNMILEGALSDHVAQGKGCYPGQEVVERVFTYGNISKKLMEIRWPQDTPLPEGLNPDGKSIHIKLLKKDDDAGFITSLRRIPWSKKVLGFGIIRKPCYEAGQKLSVDKTNVAVEVFPIPNSFEIQRPS